MQLQELQPQVASGDPQSAPASNQPAPLPVNNSASEPVDQTDPAHPSQATDIAAIVAEAERRGYLRGRNERIEQLMQSPQHQIPDGNDDESPLRQTEILLQPRVSIWDR